MNHYELLAMEETRLESLSPWSPWAVGFVAVVAAVLVVLLNSRTGATANRGVWFVSSLLRVAIVAVLAFMALGYTWMRSLTEPPDLIVVVDLSQSMRLADVPSDDGGTNIERGQAVRDRLLRPGDGWLERLKRSYRVRVYETASQATEWNPQTESWACEGTESRIGDAIASILQRQRGRATAGVLVLSDGAITDGGSWDSTGQLAAEREVPLFLLGVGNDQPRRDLEVRELSADDAVYLGDVVVVNASIATRGKGSEPMKIELRDAATAEILDTQVVEPDPSHRPRNVRLSHRPRQKGVVDYEIVASAWGDETNLDNNQKRARVEVVDRRLNVLWIESRPTFEFRFAKNLLERKLNRGVLPEGAADNSPGFRCVLLEADNEFAANDQSALAQFPETWDELLRYDLMILGDVPPTQLGQNAIRNIERFVTEQGRSLMLAAGPRFNPRAFADSPLRNLLPFRLPEMNEPVSIPGATESKPFRVTPTATGGALAALAVDDSPAESSRKWTEELEPLWWTANIGPLRPGVRTLLEKRLSNDAPSEGSNAIPAATLHFAGAGKVYFQGFDESYRWRKGDPAAYERYWLQVIRFLCRSRLASERPATLTVSQSQIRRGESVVLRASFGMESAAPADDALPVSIERDEGDAISAMLRRSDPTRRGEFEGMVAGLKVGKYHAAVSAGGDQSATCEFEVLAPQRELERPEMASEAMQRAAEISSGHFARLGDAESLFTQIPKGKGSRVASLPPVSIWNSPWLAALVVALWSLDWLLRRNAGQL